MEIPEITKILYTTDLSKNARFAFRYAVSLSNRYKAPIVIMHVIEDLPQSSQTLVINLFGEKEWESVRKKNEQFAIDQIIERLNRFYADVKNELAEPVNVEEVVVKTGNPVKKIIEESESRKCDLIVMGAHGQGGLADTLLGSTSQRILRRSRVPVMVIRLPEQT